MTTYGQVGLNFTGTAQAEDLQNHYGIAGHNFRNDEEHGGIEMTTSGNDKKEAWVDGVAVNSGEDGESSNDHKHAAARQRVWGLDARTDTNVTFEEYRYWAKIERALEHEEAKEYAAEKGPRSFTSTITNRFSTGKRKEQTEAERQQPTVWSEEQKANLAVVAEKQGIRQEDLVRVTDEEWRQAARALRTAGWSTIFYLITTDILGWSGAPFVFASVGYGIGTALYIVFGLAAGFSGFCIWRTFLALDSARFPCLSFGDPFLRLFGVRARQFINVAQSVQMFLTVAVIVLADAQIIAQISKSTVCFVACMIIVMVVGIASTSIRQLQKLGWICNLSIWLNVVSFIIIMYASKHNPIDYQVITASTLIKKIEPVVTFTGVPPAQYLQQTVGFASTFNAVNIMVYAYSGALLFVAFLAEMRHPMDFWKGVLMAQSFICFVYLLFGLYVYSNYGQYSAQNIGQVILPFSLQTANNILGLLTGWFACFLYFNVGLKTVYLEVFQEVFHFPPLMTKKGRWLWYLLGPAYWILAFIVAASVPNLGGLVSFIGGLFSLNFTYSIPVFLYLGFKVTEGATLPGEGFDPVTGVTTRHDAGLKRYVRGFFKFWYINIPVALFVMGGLACSGMGTWAATEGLISIFGPGGTVATSFGCAVPV